MSTTETFPHVVAFVGEDYGFCRCGQDGYNVLTIGATFAEDCPAALRERVAELERATPGPHISPALMRRIEALGFTPGSGEPIGWLVAQVEELVATLANERGAWVDMREDVLHGGWTNGYPIEINDVLGKIDEYMPCACTTPAADKARASTHGWTWSDAPAPSVGPNVLSVDMRTDKARTP